MFPAKFLRCLCNPRLLTFRNFTAGFNTFHPRIKTSVPTGFGIHFRVLPKFLSTETFKFEEVCSETLDSLCEYFEELVENSTHLKGADVVYGDGVLTISFGEPYGTYVINRQSPNRQIWLSSPVSGPKRYDFDSKNNGCWIYKHDGITLHQILQKEINQIVNNKADFSKCSYSLI